MYLLIKRSVFAGIAILSAIIGLPALMAQPAEYGIRIHLDPAGRIQLDTVELPAPDDVTSQPGIIVWTENGRDRWEVLPADVVPQTADNQSRLVEQLSSLSRGEPSASTEVVSQLTVALDQLVGGEVLRGVDAGGIYTPQNEMMHVQGDITIRRLPVELGAPYPKESVVITAEGVEVIRFALPQGNARLRWSEIPDLPDAMRRGLPPGEYLLTWSGGADVIFGIEEEQYRNAVLKHADKLHKVGSDFTSEWRQLAVEGLLDAKDQDGLPAPYTADAYNLLVDVPDKSLSLHLQTVRDRLLNQLRGDRLDEPDDIDPGATGIAAIDLARSRINRGRWTEAGKLLQSDDVQASPRGRALARLYEAVILSESGQATGESAYAAFMDSLEQMDVSKSPSADVFRAHNNFASFLLTRAQDQVYDHAFQIASGVASPLSIGLTDWHMSRVHFDQAWQLSQQLDTHQAAAVQTNIARQYSLLADFIRLLNSVYPEDRRFTAGEAAATAEAHDIAMHVAGGNDSQVDPATRAGAYEQLARIAHRARNGEECRRYAQLALKSHLDRGSLAGAESIHRLIGLSLRRDAAVGGTGNDSAEPTPDALHHFLVAHVLSEVLRERFPVDESGLSRAGFFARRAYVNEQIIELLISQQRFAEALDYAETAKARSFQDFLAQRGQSTSSPSAPLRSTADLLNNWPRDTAALEYFLGTERAWVFVVDTSGNVTAHLIRDQQGHPVPSPDLVMRVQHFLADTRSKASKMMRNATGIGFDKSWQDRLHEFYDQLIPVAARPKLELATLVQIVPHHILHYFPFAALVTECDPEERISVEMPQPQFLIDETFDLGFAPSLAAWDSLRGASRTAISDVNVIGISEFDDAATLPGVEKDIANFSSVFEGHQLKTLIGREADETSVSQFFDNPGLLFVATHGMNVADQPLSSYLLCHANPETDGRLTAAEILQRRIAPQLVVLSACYSGLADRSPLPGDDLFGLQRALLQSGTSSVVSGLWDVYDETGAQLMHKFFRHLKAGDCVPRALAASQREFLATCRKEGSFDPWIHPYFWAVYKATGSDTIQVAATPQGP